MARPQKAKPKKFEKLSDRLAKAAKSPVKKIAKASAVIKKKVAKKTKAALGIGYKKRTREATKGDIRRKGISNLKASNAALARFIALRYSAKAIAKYQDYAGRLRRSIRLRKQVVKIDDATFRIKGYIIRTDTAGNNPYSCTCPDFSQFSNDDRNWLSSKAGPFNPCKHMMAVRDRMKGGKWVCSSGVCTLDPLATTGYATKAICEAAIIPARFTGGQCVTKYNANVRATTRQKSDGAIIGESFNTFRDADNVYGEIEGITIENTSLSSNTMYLNAKNSLGVATKFFVLSYNPNNIIKREDEIDLTLTRVDGLLDDCGNPLGKCPI